MAFDFKPIGGGFNRGLPPLPTMPPEEAESYMSTLAAPVLSGLSYVGQSLDKPGRAIRGVLSGNLREGLAALPFSDYAGITNADQAVSGRDLLRQYGAIGEEDTPWNFAGGLAAEIALDPLTYFGGSALTKLGKTAEKAATAERVLRGGKAGAGAVNTAQAAAEAVAKGTLANTKAAQIAAKQAHLFEMGVPGFVESGLRKVGYAGPELTKGFGSGPAAIKIAEKARGLKEATLALPGVKQVNSLVNAAAGSFTDSRLAKVNEEHARTLLANRLPAVLAKHREDIQLIRNGLGVPGLDETTPWLIEYINAAKENAMSTLSPATRAELANLAQTNPQAIAKINGMVDSWKTINKAMPGIREAKGATLAELHPVEMQGLEYGARSKTDLGEDFLGTSRTPFGIESGSDLQRTVFHDVPTNTAHAISKDKMVIGSGSSATTPLQRSQYIKQKYLDPLPYRSEEAKEKIAAELADWAANQDDTMLELGLFGNNPIDDQAIRMMRELKTNVNIDSRLNALADYAKPVKKGQLEPGHVRASDALNKVGLQWNVATPAGEIGARNALAQEIARRYGAKSMSPAAMANFQVPAEWVKTLNTPMQLNKWSSAEMPFVKGMGKVNEAIRKGIYLPWMSSHVRNLTGGHLQNWLERTFDPKTVSELDTLSLGRDVPGLAAQLPRLGATDAEATLNLKNMMHDYGIDPGQLGIIDPSEFAINKMVPGDVGFEKNPALAEAASKLFRGELGGAAAALKPTKQGILESLTPFADVGGKATFRPTTNLNKKFFANRAIEEGGRAMQNTELRNQGSMFLSLLKQGFDPAVAMQKVKNAHFDYGDISEFEKNMIRPLSSVGYTFARKNLPYTIRKLADDPSRLAGLIRTGNETAGETSTGYSPLQDNYNQGFNIPIGGEYESEGKPYQKYLSRLGTPVEEALDRLNFNPNSWMPLDVKGTGAELLGLLSPALSAPLELATGRQLYSGKDLGDAKSLTGTDNMLLDQIVRGSPLSRVATTYNTLSDAKKSELEKLLQLTTGLRFRDVDLEKVGKWQERKIADEFMRRIPEAKSFETTYVPADKRSQLTPDVLRFLSADQAMKKKHRRQGEQERRQQALTERGL